jgi:hypothetical protein
VATVLNVDEGIKLLRDEFGITEECDDEDGPGELQEFGHAVNQP